MEVRITLGEPVCSQPLRRELRTRRGLSGHGPFVGVWRGIEQMHNQRNAAILHSALWSVIVSYRLRIAIAYGANPLGGNAAGN